MRKSLAEARDKAKAIARETRDAMNATSEAKRKAIEADLAGQARERRQRDRGPQGAAMANVERHRAGDGGRDRGEAHGPAGERAPSLSSALAAAAQELKGQAMPHLI